MPNLYHCLLYTSNILSEYGSNEKYSSAAEAYMTEHEDLMIAGEALQKLAGL